MIAFSGKQQILDWKVTSTGGPLTQSAGGGVEMANFAQTVSIVICLFPFRYPTTSFHFNQVWQLEKTFTSSSSLQTLFYFHLHRSFPQHKGAHLQPLWHWSRRLARHKFCPEEAEEKWSAGQCEAWSENHSLCCWLSLCLDELHWGSRKTICSFNRELALKVQNSGHRHL